MWKWVMSGSVMDLDISPKQYVRNLKSRVQSQSNLQGREKMAIRKSNSKNIKQQRKKAKLVPPFATTIPKAKTTSHFAVERFDEMYNNCIAEAKKVPSE